MSKRCLILVVSGPVASGKSTLVRKIQEAYGAVVFATRDWLTQSLTASGVTTTDRRALQAEGEKYDVLTKGQWVRDGLINALKSNTAATLVVLDSVRTKDQVTVLRDMEETQVLHVHVTAPLAVLSARYEERRKARADELPSYHEVHANPTESQVDSLREIADLVVDTSLESPEDCLKKVADLLSRRVNS